MANSVNPDQTAPVGAVCSGSTLFASILIVSNVRQLFAADDLSRQHFQMHFFLGAFRVQSYCPCHSLPHRRWRWYGVGASDQDSAASESTVSIKFVLIILLNGLKTEVNVPF